MQQALHSIRRSCVSAGTRGSLACSGYLPAPAVDWLGAAFRRFASAALRRRLRINLELALGPDFVTAHVVESWFHRLQQWCVQMCGVFNRGLRASGVESQITLGKTVEHLEDAIGQRRGVVLAAPHVFLHEVGAGIISRRFPVVALVRRSRSQRHAKLKQHWYQQVGLETVVLDGNISPSALVKQCVRLLREQRIIGITPDLVTDPSAGVPIQMFGRRLHVKPGAFAIARCARAPLVTTFGQWDATGTTAEMTFSPPRIYDAKTARGPQQVDRKVGLQNDAQQWFSEFESFLRQNPQEWLFWLDKRWTQVIRSNPEGVPEQ